MMYVSLATVVDVATNKHGKPTHILNTCVAVSNGTTAHSPETSEALYEDILGISTADLDDIPNMGITAGGADGSLENDKCSYGWTAGHIRKYYLLVLMDSCSVRRRNTFVTATPDMGEFLPPVRASLQPSTATFLFCCVFRCCLAMGVQKHYKKRFTKQIVSNCFYKVIDKKFKTVFSRFLYHVFWVFLCEGSPKTR
jgi:hypothetical protein